MLFSVVAVPVSQEVVMPRAHDLGGRSDAGPIDRTEHQLADWEVLSDSLSLVMGAKGLRTTDESRRAREDMPPELYEQLSYYEKWSYSAEALLIEKGVLTREEIDRKVAELEERWGEP
jgi:nitrile hydratase